MTYRSGKENNVKQQHYPEPKEVAPNKHVCIICENVTSTGDRGPLLTVGRRPDNGQPIDVHERCLQFVTTVKGPNFDNLYRPTPAKAASQENIWAFASKFKYYTAASGTDQMTPTVQETFPSTDMPKEEPAVTTDVMQKSKDGAPLPPQPFSKA